MNEPQTHHQQKDKPREAHFLMPCLRAKRSPDHPRGERRTLLVPIGNSDTELVDEVWVVLHVDTSQSEIGVNTQIPRRIPTHPQRLGSPLNHPDTPGKRHTKLGISPKSSSTNPRPVPRRLRRFVRSCPPSPIGLPAYRWMQTGMTAVITARIRRSRESTRASCLVLLCERAARWDCAGRCRTASVVGRLETGSVGGASIE